MQHPPTPQKYSINQQFPTTHLQPELVEEEVQEVFHTGEEVVVCLWAPDGGEDDARLGFVHSRRVVELGLVVHRDPFKQDDQQDPYVVLENEDSIVCILGDSVNFLKTEQFVYWVIR